MAVISLEIDDDLKQQMETVLKRLGLDMDTAVTMFAEAVVRENGIAFLPLKLDL